MPNWFKKVLWWTLCLFAVWAVLKYPHTSAEAVKDTWDFIKDGGGNVGTFFDEVLS